MDPKLFGGYILVGLIWGTTNALMEIGAKEKEENEKKNKSALSETGSMFSNMKFLVPFLIN